jgi:hypothetical protein
VTCDAQHGPFNDHLPSELEASSTTSVSMSSRRRRFRSAPPKRTLISGSYSAHLHGIWFALEAVVLASNFPCYLNASCFAGRLKTARKRRSCCRCGIHLHALCTTFCSSRVASHVTRHTSHVTRHTSHITRHTFFSPPLHRVHATDS